MNTLGPRSSLFRNKNDTFNSIIYIYTFLALHYRHTNVFRYLCIEYRYIFNFFFFFFLVTSFRLTSFSSYGFRFSLRVFALPSLKQSTLLGLMLHVLLS